MFVAWPKIGVGCQRSEVRERVTILATSLAISGSVAALVSWFLKWPLWACWLSVAGAMMVNGIIADWEDNRPGGFNNPNPEN